MTPALNLERAPKSFSPSIYASPRPFVAKPVAIVPATPAPESAASANDTRVEDAASSMKLMIKSVGQATARMAELLTERHDMEQALAGLQNENASLLARAEEAEEAATRHEIRASEALLKVEHLRAQIIMQSDEQERLQASVSTLLAMFGGAEALAAVA